MSKRLELKGKRFSKLTVLDIDEIKTKQTNRTHWKCLCDCGIVKTIAGPHLMNGSTISCGCIKYKADGKSTSRIYTIHKAMKARCYNTNHPGYKNYGGRGIKICDEWAVSISV